MSTHQEGKKLFEYFEKNDRNSTMSMKKVISHNKHPFRNYCQKLEKKKIYRTTVVCVTLLLFPSPILNGSVFLISCHSDFFTNVQNVHL